MIKMFSEILTAFVVLFHFTVCASVSRLTFSWSWEDEDT